MVGILLTVGCLFVAQESPKAVPTDLGPEIRRLVRQLDSPKLEQRNAAEKALAELGPDALPLLPSAEANLSAEVQQRLGRVRQQLEQKLAAAAVDPSRVTLAGDDLKLSKVLKEIQTQTGNRIIDTRERFGQPSTDTELKIDFDKRPFWAAMSQVMDQADLTIYPFGSERALYLVGRSEGTASLTQIGHSTGPFLFVPLELIARRTLNTSDEGTLRLGVLIVWEPRLMPIGLTQKLANVEAVDENGNLLNFDVQSGALEVPVNPKATAVKLSLPLVLPSRDVRKIARLSGTLDALVPGRVETFRFKDLPDAKEETKRVASATVTLMSMRKNNDIWEVEVRVRFDEAGDALASHRGWIFANEAYLEGPDGKKVENEGFETKMQSENEIGLAYFFYLEDSPKKYSFIYKTPARIFSTQLKYEFKDLDLP